MRSHGERRCFWMDQWLTGTRWAGGQLVRWSSWKGHSSQCCVLLCWVVLCCCSQGQCFVAINPNSFAAGFNDRMSDLLSIQRGMEPVSGSCIISQCVCVFICLFVVDTCWLLTHRAPAGRPRPPCAGCWRPREEQHEEMWGAGRDPLPHQCGQLHGRHRKWCHTSQKSSVLCFSRHFSKWRSSV